MDILWFTINYKLNISDESELENAENCLRIFEYGSVLNNIPSYYILQNSANDIKTQISTLDTNSITNNFINGKLKTILQNETIFVQNQFVSLASQYIDTDFYDSLVSISENIEIIAMNVNNIYSLFGVFN